ncbi:hypothetical protein ACFQH6_17535 [Halobacteriaceae archaeon GCM10025711]
MNEYLPASGNAVRSDVLVGAEAVYQPTETALQTEVTLPTGAVSTAAHDARIASDVQHGYGWRYIAATTSITQADIEHVLANPTGIYREGDVILVIGRSLTSKDKIILSIIGGTIMAAGNGYATDPCHGTVIDSEDREDHYTRDPDNTPKKPYDDRSSVEKVLEAADYIVIANNRGKRYYISKISQNTWTVIVVDMMKNANNMGPRIRTLLTDKDRGKSFIRSFDDAMRYVRDNANSIDEVIDVNNGCEPINNDI